MEDDSFMDGIERQAEHFGSARFKAWFWKLVTIL